MFGQCGGASWTGKTCCNAGSTCQVQNGFYSQCLPDTAPPTYGGAGGYGYGSYSNGYSGYGYAYGGSYGYGSY